MSTTKYYISSNGYPNDREGSGRVLEISGNLDGLLQRWCEIWRTESILSGKARFLSMLIRDCLEEEKGYITGDKNLVEDLCKFFNIILMNCYRRNLND